MLIKFIYSKFKLAFQKKSKSKFKTIIDKNTFFEGKNVLSNGDFSGSYFGFGSITGSSLPHCKIGRYTSIGRQCHIIPAFHDYRNPSVSPLFYKTKIFKTNNGFYVEIGNDVWIGSNVLIKGGVKIGDGAVVGMGAVVTKDIPPYAIVAGVPAKIIKMRFGDKEIERLTRTKWWELDYNDLRVIDTKKDIDLFLDAVEKIKKEKYESKE